MTIDQIISVLKKTKLLGTMSDNFLSTLAFSAEDIPFSTGDVLLKSKDIDIKAIIILDGRAFVQKRTNPIELKTGSIIGVLSLINNETMKDPIIAGSSGQCLILNKELFDKLIREFAEFSEHLKKQIQSKLANQIEEISNIII